MTVPSAEPARTEPSTAKEPSDIRQLQRQAITEHFLTALEDVVWRYRAMALDSEYAGLYAEVVTAEVAHQLEVARSALHRRPPLHRTQRH